MNEFPINYIGQIFRPPSEAQSLLLQVTVGCSHNRCTYCLMYKDKKFEVRSLDELKREINAARKYFVQLGSFPRKVFLCDGDALAAPTKLLLAVLKEIKTVFPEVVRVGIYVTAQNVLDKSKQELRALADNNLTIAYLGLESGANDVLKLINKGNSKEDMIRALNRLTEAGWQSSVIAMLGVGGRKYSPGHIFETADVISRTTPNYFSFLTTMALKGSPYLRAVEKGIIEPLTTKELLFEMREIIRNIIAPKRIILRVNHVSNMFPLAGTLPRDQEKILNQINKWIELEPDDVYPSIPEYY